MTTEQSSGTKYSDHFCLFRSFASKPGKQARTFSIFTSLLHAEPPPPPWRLSAISKGQCITAGGRLKPPLQAALQVAPTATCHPFGRHQVQTEYLNRHRSHKDCPYRANQKAKSRC